MQEDDVKEVNFYQDNKKWINGLVIAYGVHMFIGLLCIEYAFSRLKRFRDGNEERDSKFPAYRRLDAQ